MTTEPTYLPLLQRIASAEGNAEQYLAAWAGATPRDDVRRVIATVALREGEHSKAFQKRICELGHHVSIEEAPVTAGRVAIGGAGDLTDREKFEKLGLGSPEDRSTPDRWVCYFDDQSIDIATGELLGRFIAEERDSVRLLADCYSVLCAEEATTKARGAAETEFRANLQCEGFDDEIRMTKYTSGVDGGDLHTHPFSARLLVLEGEFILQYEGGPQTLKVGECCQIDAGTRHTECTGSVGAKVLAGLKYHD